MFQLGASTGAGTMGADGPAHELHIIIATLVRVPTGTLNTGFTILVANSMTGF